MFSQKIAEFKAAQIKPEDGQPNTHIRGGGDGEVYGYTNRQTASDDYRSLSNENEKLERQNKKLSQENKWLKESRPQETLEETITEVLCDQWIDYMDSKGNNRDHDNGMCPGNLEKEFIELITELRRFFEDHRKPSPDSYSSHDYTKRVVMTASAKAHNKIGMATLDLSPLQWELMIAITKYIEGHVIDADDIVYVAEKR